MIVLIPCYNEEKNVGTVIENIRSLAQQDVSTQLDFELDYIIINDGSIDRSRDVCKENGYRYLDLCSNLGIGGGMQAGYMYAKNGGYDIAIQHDCDGQHDHKSIPLLVSCLISKNVDIVIGSRFINKKGFQSTGFRRLGINFLSSLIFICFRVKVYDVTSGCRAVNRRFIEHFAGQYAQDYPEPEAIVDASLYNAKIVEIPVTMNKRKYGESSINIMRALYYMVKVSLSILLYRLTMTRKGTRWSP